MTANVHIFGIRHHGPGCARSLRAALETLAPDIVLIEGPPDAEDALPLMFAEGMKPPVALLVYPPDAPQRAVFYPFAEFSPEWQAARHAHEHGLPLRMMDLPQRHRLAMETVEPQEETPLPDELVAEVAGLPAEPVLEDDPLGALALAAGYGDRELWWEHQIEQRQDPAGLFEGIMEAMTAVRGQAEGERPRPARRFEAEREAFMRKMIRAARREGFERVAVVCGAWHAPALADLSGAGADNALLKGLPKIKVAATWTPWTYSRLSYRGGYGAGIFSPGWYEHLWRHLDGAATRWIARAARLLRDEGLDASSASVIEAARLAESLAVLRDRPMPGLAELTEAIQAVLCGGDSVPLELIRARLEIGDRLGAAPAAAPAPPLQKDLEAQQKRLRLKPSPEIKTLDLDLRKENDRARGRLLRRLALLGVPWGEAQSVAGKSGTFHEIWRLQWNVEFVVRLIEAGAWGNTIETAAAAVAADRALKAETLAELTALLDETILAELFEAVERVLERLQTQAAVAADTRHLMEALPPLVRVARYGDVRRAPGEPLRPVLESFLERVFVGLAPACASLNDEAAEAMTDAIDQTQQSLDLLNEDEHQAAWRAALRQLLDNDGVHGLVRGRCCRLLLEGRVLAEEELHRRARLALSPATPAARAAAWIEGLLRGGGLALLHQDAVWVALDHWLAELREETFVELLPLLRRAFGGFQSPERRAMGEKIKKLTQPTQGRAPGAASESVPLDHARARRVLPVLAQVLGVEWENDQRSAVSGQKKIEN